MEKVKFYNSKGLALVGNVNSVNSDKIIIMAHGFTNNKSSNGRFDRLSESLNKIGYDTLAFDFSGCGESDDNAITSKSQVDDLNSAINYALSRSYQKINLFGNSFGTLACMKCRRNEVITMILVGALTDSMCYDWNEYYTKEQLYELESKGFFYFDSSSERRYKIVKQTIMDFEQVSLEDLVKDINCPVLLIHGNNKEDNEELQLLERSRRAVTLMPEGSRLVVIEGAKHGIRNDWDKVIEISCDWYTS